MQFNVSNEICDWLLKYFLPTIYWQLQINKCRNKAMEQSYITAGMDLSRTIQLSNYSKIC